MLLTLRAKTVISVNYNSFQRPQTVPDGLIDSDSIVNIKCPFIAAHVTLQQAIEQNKIEFCRLESGELLLNKDDRY
ncbi:hypothetical protein PR048_012776 [Dryococelus australis]|uniref:Uncharacterized protein n=1 Tax=Dryococelus australis TaxID=614101 RepID=A0ABQ9HQC3_9NEOP|nr:hypothetical protein PR048_012776 [Dryococelus australis]